MVFSRVHKTPLNGPIARVNRDTNELFIDPKKWNRLTGLHREFIILHEKGHLILQTPDEITANKFAIRNFLPIGEFQNEDYAARVNVLSDLTENQDYYPDDDQFSNFLTEAATIFSGIASYASGLKQKEAAADESMRKTVTEKYSALKSSTQARMITIVIAIIALVGIAFFAFKKLT